MLRALEAVAEQAAARPDPAELARFAVDRVRALFQVDAAKLYWWDAAEGRLALLASTDARYQPDPAVTRRPGQGLTGRVWQRAKPLTVNAYPRWPGADPESIAHGVTAALGVPLAVGEQVVGVLVTHAYAPHRFTREQERALRLVGNQVATALQAGRQLTEATRREAERAALIEQQRLLVEVQRSEERLRSILEGLACGVLVCDVTGQITRANAAATELFQLAPGALIGRDATQSAGVLREDGSDVPADAQPVTRVLRGGQAVRHEVVGYRSPDGTIRWYLADARPLTAGDGKLTDVVCSYLEITALKEAQRRLEAFAGTEKLHVLGEMAAGVAHGLNQYLTLISGHADLALTRTTDPAPASDDLRQSIETIAQAAQDGATLVKQLLVFGRPDLDEAPERVAVATLLVDVARLTAPRWRESANQEGRSIRLDVVAEDDPRIVVRAEGLREALTNLVFNAVDALPSGGAIRLAARGTENEVVIEVVDDGIGIPPEVQDRVFEPFFSTKGARGTGLGLSVVLSVVERNGGRISFESAPGQGTVFRLVFPAAAALAPVAPAPPAAATRRPRRLRVLAVDDEPALVDLVAQMLEADGHTVTTAISGEEARDKLALSRFDLVISDLGLGAGLTGWDVADEVRRRFPETHVVLVTGWGFDLETDRTKERGVDAVLAKPYRIAELRRVIEAL